MSKIQQLNDDLINKIAAGEVVERPASVVKELIENAIDAGAQNIEIELEEGGHKLIVIRDDGSGMTPEDLLNAPKRHYTSKVTHIDDLFQIETMGFRGEALASISSVSRFTIQSRRKGSESGAKISIDEHGPIESTWNGSHGTEVIVKDLFYNVPARKNFLKSPQAEYAACLELVTALALSRPDLGFTLHHNTKNQLRVRPCEDISYPVGEKRMRQRVEDIIPKVPFCYVYKSEKFASIEALISPPGFEKSTSKQMYMFINGRYVKDKTVRYSILRGYHSHLLKGKFPVVVLYLNVDPSLVDVNVHPSKAEVRFQYHSEVQKLIATTLKDRLRDADWARGEVEPGLPVSTSLLDRSLSKSVDSIITKPSARSEKTAGLWTPKTTIKETHTPVTKSVGVYQPTHLKTKLVSVDPAPLSQTPKIAVEPAQETQDTFAKYEKDTTPQKFFSDAPKSMGDIEVELPISQKIETSNEISQSQAVTNLPWEEMEYLGTFAACYLIFTLKSELIVIDQHAFHERIIYEQLTQNQELLHEVQPLLMPEVLQLSPSLVSCLVERTIQLKQYGIGIQKVSDDEIEVQSVPSLLKNSNLEALLTELAGHITLDEDLCSSSEITHTLLSTIACHSAVRAGDTLARSELDTLIEAAHSVDFYHNCPHGRPVIKTWKKNQVEHWFKRL